MVRVVTLSPRACHRYRVYRVGRCGRGNRRMPLYLDGPRDDYRSNTAEPHPDLPFGDHPANANSEDRIKSKEYAKGIKVARQTRITSAGDDY